MATTDWGYVRLRRSDYNTAALSTWAKRQQKQPWQDAFVFFKHEDQGPQDMQSPLPRHPTTDRSQPPRAGGLLCMSFRPVLSARVFSRRDHMIKLNGGICRFRGSTKAKKCHKSA